MLYIYSTTPKGEREEEGSRPSNYFYGRPTIGRGGWTGGRARGRAEGGGCQIENIPAPTFHKYPNIETPYFEFFNEQETISILQVRNTSYFEPLKK